MHFKESSYKNHFSKGDLMNITEFQKSRFGLFIHWGIYSIPARGEWVRSNEEMKEEDYIPFANEFDPDLFDPHQWAKLVKKAHQIM